VTDGIKPGMVRTMKGGRAVWDYPPVDPVVSDITSRIGNELSIRIEQHLSACIRPKPRFISQRLWLRLASLFIYVEKTQPRLRMEGND